MAKIITVFFSMKGETYINGSIVNLSKGNTNVAAEFVQEAVGGDIFEIEAIREYSKEHFTMIEEAKEELRKGELPAIKKFLDNLEDYDTIFLGYPNWWGTLPMPVVTFLSYYDWKGKTIIPFCSNEGSGLGKSVNDLKRHCPNAVIKEGISIHGAETQKLKAKIMNWAKGQIKE